MKILLIGSKGQLGIDLQESLKHHQLLTPSHETLDITNIEQIRSYLTLHQPASVINTSAFHDVPKCELEPQNSFSVNSFGPYELAKACRDIGAVFYHISTDYVFDGKKGAPYVETDIPTPLMIYGASKLAGEHLIRSIWEKSYIIRTTGLFGENPCRAKPGGRNFIELMLHLGRTNGRVKVVNDQWCCPTFTPELANQISIIIDGQVQPGIIHAVSPPGCTWYDYANLIFETAKINVTVDSVPSDYYPVQFRRPADSRLECETLKQNSIYQMRPLRETIEQYISTKKL